MNHFLVSQIQFELSDPKKNSSDLSQIYIFDLDGFLGSRVELA